MKLADLHVDTMHRSLERGWDVLHGEADAHVDVPRLLDAGVRCLGLSLWTDPGEEAMDRTRRQLELAEGLVAARPETFTMITDARSPASLEQSDGVGLLVHVEGAHGVGDSLEVLEEYVGRGVRGLTLTWNNSNGLADSCVDPRSPSGLTPLGREFVDAMSRWGCVVDLAHASKATFWDVMGLAADRAWVSHAGCLARGNHPRNLDDEQIRALGRAGSVVGLIAHPLFLNPDDPESVTMETVADHIEHAASVGGTGCVAIGTDFDGISIVPKDMRGVEDLPALLDVLRRRGWSEAMLDALCWRNPMRVLKRALPPAP